MGRGIVVKHAGDQRPSEHFGQHMVGASMSLGEFVSKLIDGEQTRAVEPVEVVTLETDGRYARIAVVDIGTGEEHAFVLSFKALSDAERQPPPSRWDSRPTAILLRSFHSGDDWDVFNCYIVDFTAWPRSEIYAGNWPSR